MYVYVKRVVLWLRASFWRVGKKKKTTGNSWLEKPTEATRDVRTLILYTYVYTLIYAMFSIYICVQVHTNVFLRQKVYIAALQEGGLSEFGVI